jgi:undecaprenyl-diphosphatase
MSLLEQTDRALMQYANQFAGHSVVLDKLMYDLADSSVLNGGVFIAALCWLWFETDENGVHAQRRNIVVSLLAATVAGGLSRLLQVTLPVHRLPLHNLDLGISLPFGVDPAPLNEFSSFPSNHAVLFFALTVPLWMRSRWLGVAAVVWTLLMICLPLLYLGYHWPSDLVAGAVVGVAIMLLMFRLIGSTGLPDKIVRFSATHPSAFCAIAWLFALEIALRFGDVRAFFLDAVRVARALLSDAPG